MYETDMNTTVDKQPSSKLEDAVMGLIDRRDRINAQKHKAIEEANSEIERIDGELARAVDAINSALSPKSGIDAAGPR